MQEKPDDWNNYLVDKGSYDHSKTKLETFKTQLEGRYKRYVSKRNVSVLAETEAFLSLLENSPTFTALYYNLAIAAQYPSVIQPLYDLFTRSSEFRLGILHEKNNLDARRNPILALHFEIDLAHALLESAPKEILARINQAIIAYLERNRASISARDIERELIHFHISEDKDFVGLSAVDVLIQKLSRPLDCTQFVCESASLHLCFFNWRHIYKPELDVESEQKNVTIEERSDLHRMIRDKGPNGLFGEKIRGRDSVYNQNQDKTRDFGHTEADNVSVPHSYFEWVKNWHIQSFTPFYKRAAAYEDSPLVQTLRANRIPYIAGPSGTTADCLEGLHFLMPAMTEQEKAEYLNLLAAAEVAMGHHALHEIVLVAKIRGIFPLIRKKSPSAKAWDLDFSISYEYFLSDSFKTSRAYSTLSLKYPHFLHPRRHAVQIPNFEQDLIATTFMKIRAVLAYKKLSQGLLWKNLECFNTGLSHNTFRKLSADNLRRLKCALYPLTEKESHLFHQFIDHSVELSHYTEQLDSIIQSDELLPYHILDQRFEGVFENNSSERDIECLGNHGFVFFRFTLQECNKDSFFGTEKLVFDGKNSTLFQNGWISLYEMLLPQMISCVQKLEYRSQTIRAFESKDSHILTMRYNGSMVYQIDLVETVFYGPDIMKGLAYAILRELRRLGGEFQSYYLDNAFNKDALNKLLSQLFRVEAKIPGAINLKAHPDRGYLARNNRELAIKNADLQAIQSLLQKGCPLDALGRTGQPLLVEIASIVNDKGLYLLDLFPIRNENIPKHVLKAAQAALAVGNLNCVSYLVTYLNAEEVKALAFDACYRNMPSVLDSLCTHGLKLNVVNEAGMTLLQVAAQNDCMPIIQKLFKLAPELLNREDKVGNTAACHAAFMGSFSALAWLTAYSESLKHQNKRQETPLHLAIRQQNGSCVDFIWLMTDPLMLHTKDIEGNTPFLLAVKCLDAKRVKAFIDEGANLLDQNHSGETVLNVANDEGVLSLLIEYPQVQNLLLNEEGRIHLLELRSNQKAFINFVANRNLGLLFQNYNGLSLWEKFKSEGTHLPVFLQLPQTIKEDYGFSDGYLLQILLSLDATHSVDYLNEILQILVVRQDIMRVYLQRETFERIFELLQRADDVKLGLLISHLSNIEKKFSIDRYELSGTILHYICCQTRNKPSQVQALVPRLLANPSLNCANRAKQFPWFFFPESNTIYSKTDYLNVLAQLIKDDTRLFISSNENNDSIASDQENMLKRFFTKDLSKEQKIQFLKTLLDSGLSIYSLASACFLRSHIHLLFAFPELAAGIDLRVLQSNLPGSLFQSFVQEALIEALKTGQKTRAKNILPYFEASQFAGLSTSIDLQLGILEEMIEDKEIQERAKNCLKMIYKSSLQAKKAQVLSQNLYQVLALKPGEERKIRARAFEDMLEISLYMPGFPIGKQSLIIIAMILMAHIAQCVMAPDLVSPGSKLKIGIEFAVQGLLAFGIYRDIRRPKLGIDQEILQRP